MNLVMDKIKTYKILEKLARLDVENQQRRLKNLLDEQKSIEERIDFFQENLKKERSFLLKNFNSSHDFYTFEKVVVGSIHKLKNRLSQVLGAIEGEKAVLLDFFSTQKKIEHVEHQEEEKQKDHLTHQEEMLIEDLILMRGIKKI